MLAFQLPQFRSPVFLDAGDEDSNTSGDVSIGDISFIDDETSGAPRRSSSMRKTISSRLSRLNPVVGQLVREVEFSSFFFNS